MGFERSMNGSNLSIIFFGMTGHDKHILASLVVIEDMHWRVIVGGKTLE